MAQPFDLERLALTGDPVRVVDNVFSDPQTGWLGLSTSDQGGLVYISAVGSTLTQLRSLDRSGDELGTVGETGEVKTPLGWSSAGGLISYTVLGADFDLWVLPTSGDGEPTSFLGTPFQDAFGVISPDGRWMAYWSDESVEPRVYVRSVPPSGRQWQVSTGAGLAPRRRVDGSELYWITLDNRQLMAVDIDVAGDAPIIGTPHQLFEAPFRVTPTQRNVFDVSADGHRFLVNTLVEGARSASITWVLAWTAELEQ